MKVRHCRVCRGTGQVDGGLEGHRLSHDLWAVPVHYTPRWVDCPNCNGTGHIIEEG